MNLIKLITIALSLVIISACSSNDNAGSTTVGNGLASSVVVYDKKGITTQVNLYSNDSVRYTAQTNSDGSFEIQDLPYGNYHLEVLDTTLQLGLWLEDLQLNSSSRFPDSLLLDPLQTLTVFTSDSLANKTSLLKLRTPSATLNVSSVENYEGSLIGMHFHNIAPGKYSQLSLIESSIPLTTWKDFKLSTEADNHLYWGENQATTPRLIWNFPLIVGVSDSMVEHYGGLEALKSLIQNQISESQKVFSNSKIKAKLNYSVDSIFVFFGDLQTENTPPPSNFAYKLLYSPFEVSPVGNWSETLRVGVNDFPESESSPAFSTESHKTLAWLFGLFRGAHYSSIEEVSKAKNTISNTDYLTSPIVMSLRSSDSLSDYTLEIINKNNNSWKWSSDTLSKDLAPQIQLQLRDNNDTPLENVQVQVFGVTPNSFEVNPTPLLSLKPNSSGRVNFDDLHFINPTNKTLDYSNFLVQTSYNNQDSFHWMPYSEIGLYSLQNPDSTTYTQSIVIDSP